MEKKILTIDIGGTFIKYGLIDHCCHLTELNKIKTPLKSKKDLLQTLCNIYMCFQKQIEGIAISVPGIIEVDKGYIFIGGALSYLNGVYLAKELSTLCNHVPVSIENDGKAAAQCEAWQGNAKGTQNSVSLIFGTGIGGGIIVNGKILRGSHLLAGEFGQCLVNFLDDTSFDIINNEMSTLSVVKKVRHALKDDSIQGEDMMLYYQQGNPLVVSLLDHWFMVIAKFCFLLECMYDPEVICIGGGMSENPIFIEKIKEFIENVGQHLGAFKFPNVNTCYHYNRSNLIGAYYHFCQKYKGDVL